MVRYSILSDFLSTYLRISLTPILHLSHGVSLSHSCSHKHSPLHTPSLSLFLSKTLIVHLSFTHIFKYILTVLYHTQSFYTIPSLSLYLSFFLSFSLSTFLSTFLSLFLSLSLSLSFSFFLSFFLSFSLSLTNPHLPTFFHTLNVNGGHRLRRS